MWPIPPAMASVATDTFKKPIVLFLAAFLVKDGVTYQDALKRAHALYENYEEVVGK